MWVYLEMSRPSHQVKNALVPIGFLLGVLGTNSSPNFGGFLLTTMSFVFASAASYVLNEWLDRHADALHPDKKSRPAVLGLASAPGVYGTVSLFAMLALLSAPSWTVRSLVAIFLVLAFVYNVPPLRAKDRRFIDVLVEAANAPLRLLGGLVAAGQPASFSFELFLAAWLLGAYLMTMKRFSERKRVGSKSADAIPSEYRPSLARYSSSQLRFVQTLYLILGVSFLFAFSNGLNGSDIAHLALYASLAVGVARLEALVELANPRISSPEGLVRDTPMVFASAAVILSMSLLILS